MKKYTIFTICCLVFLNSLYIVLMIFSFNFFLLIMLIVFNSLFLMNWFNKKRNYTLYERELIKMMGDRVDIVHISHSKDQEKHRLSKNNSNEIDQWLNENKNET